MTLSDRRELSAEHAALLEAAGRVRQRAYAPYSGFLVGAAILTADEQTIVGCNVENAAYPATICAERAAVVSAVAAGHQQFTAVAVIGSGDGPTAPCGICRQVLAEFGIGMTVISAGTTGAVDVRPLAELLPEHFGPERLR